MILDNKDNITVIITTHNREKYLFRSLDYYSNFDLDLIVCDSSEKRFNFTKYSINNNWEYHYFPELSMAEKLSRVLENLKTKYAVICADDDFIIPSAIDECVNFLNLNDEYVCATGYITTFIKEGKIPYFKPGYKQLLNNYEIAEDSAGERLLHQLSDYFPTFYAVHKTESLRSAFQLMKKNPRFLELTQSLSTAINGKIKSLPVFYGVWEGILNSAGQVYVDFHTLSSQKKYKDEYNQWIDCLTDYLIKHEGCSPVDANKKLTQAIACYLSSINGSISLKLKRQLKKIRAIRMINFKMKTKLLKRQSIDECFYNKGFPFFDEKSKADFNQVKECILSHEV